MINSKVIKHLESKYGDSSLVQTLLEKKAKEKAAFLQWLYATYPQLYPHLKFTKYQSHGKD